MNNRERGTLPGSRALYPINPGYITDNYYYICCTGHFICDRDYCVTREEYPDPILIYIISGILAVDFGGRRYNACEGEIVLLDCSTFHRYFANPNTEFVFFHFNGVNSTGLTKSIIKQNDSVVFNVPWSSGVKTAVTDIITKLDMGYPVFGTEMSNMVYTVLCSLTTYNNLDAGANKNISGIIKYIHENISQDITLDELAARAFLSPYYFSRLFKKETGFSPMEYVATIRMNTAKVLLKTTNMSVQDISARLGYTYAGFINAFTRKNGIPPMKFRHCPM